MTKTTATDSVLAELDLPQLPQQKSPDYRNVYTNFGAVLAAPYDISVLVCEVIQDGRGGAAIEQKVRIAGHPAFMRTLAQVILRNVEGWEKLYGELKDPSLIKSADQKS
jgi:hypothetical protein